MIKVIAIIISITFSFVSFSQNIINQEIINETSCETKSDLLGNYLANYYFIVSDQLPYDSINMIVQDWQNTCGLTEPILRLTILNRLNHNKKSDSLIIKYFQDAYNESYAYKTQHLSEYEKDSLFKNNKSIFGYINFNHSYDEMTQAMAQKIITQSTNFYVAKFCNLLLKTSSEEIYTSQTTQNNTENYQEQGLYSFASKITLGAWTPSRIKYNNFPTTPYFGIGVEVNGESWYFEIEVKMRFLSSEYAYDFKVNHDIFVAEPNIGINSGFKYGYRIFKAGPVHTYLNTGLGIDITDTGIIKEEIYDEESGDYYYRYYYLSTVHSSIGTILLIKPKNGGTFGLEANLHYYPYSLSSRLVSDLPGSGFSVGLFIKFD